jgi:prepilin-type N-terminal cleavage/methylation domain-containing protein
VGTAVEPAGKDDAMRRTRETGFTLVEILVVITIIATIAGLVAVLIPKALEMQARQKCIDNLRNITGLLAGTESRRYPEHAGPNLILYLVKKGDLTGRDSLESLFCPGDHEESFKQAGGEAAYEGLDLKRKGEYGHLTSYAGRDQTRADTAARRGSMRAVVLVADDSEDHHFNKGVCVGLTGGTARWRDKVEYYELDGDTPLIVGEGSEVEELTCLRTD